MQVAIISDSSQGSQILRTSVVSVVSSPEVKVVESKETRVISVETPKTVVAVGIPGQKGEDSADTSLKDLPEIYVIPPLDTLQIDDFSVQNFTRSTWYLDLYTDAKHKYVEVFCTVSPIGIVRHSVGNTSGDRLSYSIQVDIQLGFARLLILNREALPMSVSGNYLKN